MVSNHDFIKIEGIFSLFSSRIGIVKRIGRINFYHPPSFMDLSRSTRPNSSPLPSQNIFIKRFEGGSLFHAIFLFLFARNWNWNDHKETGVQFATDRERHTPCMNLERSFWETLSSSQYWMFAHWSPAPPRCITLDTREKRAGELIFPRLILQPWRGPHRHAVRADPRLSALGQEQLPVAY